MVEYGPFIEYCCELYVHHTVLNVVVVSVVAVSVLAICFTHLFYYLRLYRAERNLVRACETVYSCIGKAMSVDVCSDDHREANAAPAAFDCEDAISNEKE